MIVWIVGVLFGVIAAAIHVYVPEQGLTFLWVMFSTMVLGLWHRERPWRWIIAVVPLVPIVDIIRKVQHPAEVSRAAVIGALAAGLAAIPGAIGGAYMRLFIENVFDKKKE
ncbi:MAG TPA: hypothetical protein VGL89_05100 [Candidatus Koribacter sp.]|jgi:ABC-type polysaccharide/polyol phosphate export permease